MEPEKRDRVNLLWELGGVYLIYSGGELLYRLITGTGPRRLAAVTLVSGLVFLLVGGLMLLREWKAYRRQREFDAWGPAEEEEPGGADGEGGEDL